MSRFTAILAFGLWSLIIAISCLIVGTYLWVGWSIIALLAGTLAYYEYIHVEIQQNNIQQDETHNYSL
jgi:hypothetical protein